ncbi:MAG: DUF4347 domain-containing protein [Leptolyngbyaceae cyanobacterium SL_7_1]|nr:DUF4347 domain-containing protein [Leptolyngbyaceae cyanobacterium SL_7_1]
MSHSSPVTSSQLVFIDPALEDWTALVNGVLPGVEVFLLHPHEDGIAQIAAILMGRTGIAAIHLVSHGKVAGLRLGTAELNWATLDRYQASLQQWRSALTDDANLLLYGCNVAANADGVAFIHALKASLGAEVAASTTPTGSVDKGGDWQLSAATGAIWAELAFCPATIATYSGVMLDAIDSFSSYFSCGCAACSLSYLTQALGTWERSKTSKTTTTSQVVYTDGPMLQINSTTTTVAATAATTVLLAEDFSATDGDLPEGWESQTLEGNPETDQWRTDNPGDRDLDNVDDPFAVYDSDALSNDNVAESVAFVSPIFNASAAPGVFLQFDQFYGGFQGGEFASEIFVEASTDGVNWEVAYSSNIDGFLVNSPTVDLTDSLQGSDTAQVRFRFDGNWSYLWAIDNVEVVDYLPPGVTLPAGVVGVSESNVPDPLDFSFALESRPSAPVTLNFTVDGEQLQPIESITFNPEDWFVPQISLVQAVVDDLYEGEDVVSEVQIEIVSDDPAYSGLVLETVPVQVTETTIPGFTSYRTVEKTFADLSGLAQTNPDLASWVDIGDSYDKIISGGAAGFDIFALELGNQATDQVADRFGPKGKPILFVQASIHAREYSTAEVITRFAEQLVAGYGKDAEITALLDYVDIRIVPIVNPDGRKFAEQGYSWRKNTNPGDGTAPFPIYGVDLNRNYDSQWGQVPGGASTDPADLTYQGTAPFSEPESQALRDYLLATLPDEKGEGIFDPAPDDKPNIYYDVHSFGNLVLYPAGYDPDPSTEEIELVPNYEGLRNLGLKVGYFTGVDGEAYDVQRALSLYATSGTTDDWVYQTFGNASYTLELGTDFFQDVEYFEEIIVPELIPGLLYSGKAAYAPYLVSEGSDTIDTTLDLAQVVAGTTVTLTATADDTRYDDDNGNSPEGVTEGLTLPDPDPITAARYSIDAPSWIPGTELFELMAAMAALTVRLKR